MVYFTKQVATTKGEKLLYIIIATYIDISKCVYVLVGPWTLHSFLDGAVQLV